jgi:hypothetical protein
MIISRKESLAEFAPAGAKKMKIIFCGGVYVTKNTLQVANVRVSFLWKLASALQRPAIPQTQCLHCV